MMRIKEIAHHNRIISNLPQFNDELLVSEMQNNEGHQLHFRDKA